MIGPVWHGGTASEDFTYSNDIGFHFGNRKQAEFVVRVATEGTSAADSRIAARSFLLNIKIPLPLPDLYLWDPVSVKGELIEQGVITPEQAAAGEIVDQEVFRDWLESAGYDGVVYENQSEGCGWSYIALRSEQIHATFVP